MEAWDKFDKAGTADQPAAGRGPREIPAASRCRSGSSGPTRTRTRRGIFKLQLEVMEIAELRLRHARHVQGPEARSLTPAGTRSALCRGTAHPPASPSRWRSAGLAHEHRHAVAFTFVLPALALLGRADRISAGRDVPGRAAAAARRAARASLFVAYLFWLCAGFIGLHRFYLQEPLGLRLHPGVPRHPLFQRSDPRRARGRVAHPRRL